MQFHSTPTPYFPENLQDYAPWVTKHGLLQPYGECQCGCKQAAKIATRARARLGYIKDQPVRFVAGHQQRVRYKKPSSELAPWVARYGLKYPYGECQCGCRQATKIALHKLTSHDWAKGHPIRFISGHETRKSLSEKFWPNVSIQDGDACWEWTGAFPTGRKYGHITHRGKTLLAHRISWILHHGDIPDNLFVLHKCDNPSCVRISHLFLGTCSDNVQDMMQKGRGKPPLGERHYHAKLNSKQVLEIRRMYAAGNISKPALGRHFGVSRGAVQAIVTRSTWKHI